jgi:hypothetical protein
MTSASGSERELPTNEAVPEENPEGPSLAAAASDERVAADSAPQDDDATDPLGSDEDEQTGRTTLPAVAAIDTGAETERDPVDATALPLAGSDAAEPSDDGESSDDSDLMLEDDGELAAAAPHVAASDEGDASAEATSETEPSSSSPLLEELAAASMAPSPAESVSAEGAPSAPEPASSEDSAGGDEAESPERVTMPDSIAAKRRDEPLPSFDIPELESAQPAPVAPAAAAAVPALAPPWAAHAGSRPGSDPPPRPRVPSPLDNIAVAPAPPPVARFDDLDELDEDEEDAVTSIELSIADVGDVPSAPSSFEVAKAGFVPEVPAAVVAAPAVAFAPTAMPELNPRRAATVLIRRVESAAPPGVAAAKRASGQLLARVGEWFGRRRLPRFEGPGVLPWKRALRFVDSILPELSLVLFGSGLGAGVVLLVMKPQAPPPASEHVQAQALQPLRADGTSDALTERVRTGDREALASVAALPPNQRSSALVLAKEEGEGVQSRQAFRAFLTAFELPGGEASTKELGRFVDFATNSATMVDAFAALSELPGPQGPDLVYSVWENAPGGNRAAVLARNLLHTPDQRSKASPALLAALDLSDGKSCEDYARALPAVLAHGDERSLSLMVALTHTDGCGDDRAQDCYPCLRETNTLAQAIEAVKQRPAPRP